MQEEGIKEMRGVKQGVKYWTSASVEANKYQIKDTIFIMNNQKSYLNDLEIRKVGRIDLRTA